MSRSVLGEFSNHKRHDADPLESFVDECLKPNSPLWYTTAGGKQNIDTVLLERATDDLVNILYNKEHPGTLRMFASLFYGRRFIDK